MWSNHESNSEKLRIGSFGRLSTRYLDHWSANTPPPPAPSETAIRPFLAKTASSLTFSPNLGIDTLLAFIDSD